MSSKQEKDSNKWNKYGIITTAFFCGGLFTYYYMKNKHEKEKRHKYLDSSTSIISSNINTNTPSTASILKKHKPIRIYIDGCWDVMHSGHYNAIRQAKALGDYLVVGVHSDEEITCNKREPIMNNEERLAAVKACKWVDQIEFGAPYSPTLKLLNDLNCDFCAHGDDIPVASDGKSAYDEVRPKLKIFSRTPGVSTTHLIERLLRATQQPSSPTLSISKSPAMSDSVIYDSLENKTNGKGNSSSSSSSLPLPAINVDLRNINAKYEKKIGGETEDNDISWSSFLASATRISAFSNHQIPKSDDVVVYIDGVFDLFHIGHISALKAAKALGTFLYVGLYDDSIIRARKGRNFPLMGIQERVLNVLSCKYVDEVLIGAPWIINEETLKSLNISYVVITKNTAFAENEMSRYSIARERGILREIETDNGFTTNGLMMRIKHYQNRIKVQNEGRVIKAKKYVQDSKYVEETS